MAVLPTELAVDHTGGMVNAEGEQTEKNVWGKRRAWIDYYGQVDGKRLGVAIFAALQTLVIQRSGFLETMAFTPRIFSDCSTSMMTICGIGA